MKFLVVHPGSSVSTHDVFMGLQEGLRHDGHEIVVYPLDRRVAAAGKFLRDQRAIEIEQLGMDLPVDVSHGEVLMQACDGLLVRALVTRADWVIIVSGMYVPLAVLQILRIAKIKVALLLTESPYDEEHEAKWSAVADVTFTNERTTAKALGIEYLPHAWRRGVHDAVPDASVTAWLDGDRSQGCVFVGTGFAERVDWLVRYAKAGGPLTLFGTWPDDAVKAYLADPEREEWVVKNEEAAALYQRFGATLNLYRTSKGDTGFSEAPQHIARAESLNPRAYELAALGCLHVSTPRAEVVEKFGDLVPVAETPEQAAEQVRAILALSPGERFVRSEQIRSAVAGDTWHDRARTVVDVLSRR